MTAPIGFAAARAPRAAITATLAAFLLGLALLPQSAPTLTGAALQPVAPFAPAPIAMAAGLLLTNPMSSIEGTVPRSRLQAARAVWCIVVMTLTSVAMAAALPLAAPTWHLPLLRNTILLDGFAVLAAVLMGSRLAWLAVVVLGLPNLLAGQTPDGTAATWAVLVQPADSLPAAACTVTVALVALVAYTVADTQATSGLSREVE
jgi:hypothetical protein